LRRRASLQENEMISRMRIGSFGRTLRIAVAVLAIYALLAPRAQADTIAEPTQVQSSVFVAGNYSNVFSINTSGPGQVTVRLENISWPERLAQLDCSIYSNDGFLQALKGTIEWKFMTTGPNSFYASIVAGAGGKLNLGLFSIKITFKDAASLVPLPAAIWMLGPVLGFFGLRRVMPTSRFDFGQARFA